MARRDEPQTHQDQHQAYRDENWYPARDDQSQPTGFNGEYYAKRRPSERVGYGYKNASQGYENNYQDEIRQGDPNAYSGGSAPYGFDPNASFREGESPNYWGGHRGAEDRFDSGLTDRYGYGRGDFQDRDIYGRQEYYSEGPEAEYQIRARNRGQNNPPVGGYIHAGRSERAPVSHRGRGPKGYQRSDERILEDVCELLSDDPMIDASDIQVSCKGGIVTLEGSVDSRSKKHRVEILTADVRGVKDIANELTIAMGWQGGRTHLDE